MIQNNDIYLIDFENVKNTGIKGLSNIQNNSVVNIISTENAPKVTLEEVITQNLELKFTFVEKGEQSADMHIASLLGNLLNENNKEQKVFIVSKDTDFDTTINFWKQKGWKNIKKITSIQDSITRNNNSSKEKTSQIEETKNPEKTKNSTTNQNSIILKHNFKNYEDVQKQIKFTAKNYKINTYIEDFLKCLVLPEVAQKTSQIFCNNYSNHGKEGASIVKQKLQNLYPNDYEKIFEFAKEANLSYGKEKKIITEQKKLNTQEKVITNNIAKQAEQSKANNTTSASTTKDSSTNLSILKNVQSILVNKKYSTRQANQIASIVYALYQKNQNINKENIKERLKKAFPQKCDSYAIDALQAYNQHISQNSSKKNSIEAIMLRTIQSYLITEKYVNNKANHIASLVCAIALKNGNITRETIQEKLKKPFPQKCDLYAKDAFDAYNKFVSDNQSNLPIDSIKELECIKEPNPSNNANNENDISINLIPNTNNDSNNKDLTVVNNEFKDSNSDFNSTEQLTDNSEDIKTTSENNNDKTTIVCNQSTENVAEITDKSTVISSQITQDDNSVVEEKKGIKILKENVTIESLNALIDKEIVTFVDVDNRILVKRIIQACLGQNLTLQNIRTNIKNTLGDEQGILIYSKISKILHNNTKALKNP